ncbi:TPA: phage minor head protein [Haemophilus influenzae]|uniref:phage head morphogenesis protein n=1 Tax=Haemophilus influenzae TaxID=727 RepID=UPI0018646D70|nr:phage minor head protein [Haemophilus influenzae]MCK9002484.1 phage minor head protein [Haemophilus influenzae]
MSKRTELWYRQQLKQFVKMMTNDVERALQQPQGSFFMDDAKGFQAISAKALMKVLEKYEKSDRTSQAENIANGFVGRGDAQNHAEVSTNLKNQTGIDLSAYLRNSPNIAEKVNALTAGNIQLIKSIRSQYLDKVQNAVMQAMVRGSLNKDLAAQIKDLGKTTEKRALFIARDQSSKLNAALTQARHEDVGVKKYMWSTSGDERVRASHSEKDGQIFEYANPPADTGHPGHDVNCRCVQIPVLDNNEQIVKNSPIVSQQEKQQMRSEWSDDFPDTIIDRKLGDATSHPLYENAKKGSIEDAYQLAKDLVTDDAVNKLKQLIGNKNAILIPVHAEEAVGRNMIPVAIATVLSKKLHIPVDLSIVQATKVSRTGGDGWHRLVYSPAFDGIVPKDKYAIILDDTQTQGGTLASLKGYIEGNKGKVIASYALTGKQYSVQLRLSKYTLAELRSKYGELESWWKKEFGYDFSRFTEWEARFIINSRKTPDEVRNTILARKQA